MTDIGSVAYTLLLLLSAMPATLHAQDESRPPDAGSYGLSFSLPEGGGAGFGVRKLLSSSTNAGVDVVVSLDRTDSDQLDEDPRTRFHLELIPNVRLYRGASNTIRPFLHLGVSAGYTRAPQDSWGTSAGVEAGLGAEWFPVSRISISGSTGARATYAHNSGVGSSITVLGLSAFRSVLLLNVYF